MMETVLDSKNRPLVTVVMPAFNAEQYIAESIESISSQSVKDWELIVVDDCSKDRTREIVRTFEAKDPRIRLVCNDVNSGVAKTRNRAMDLARGRYVAFLDSDDIWYPEKLEKQLRCMEQTGAELCYTSYRLVKANDKMPISDYLVPEKTSFENMLGQNCIGCSTVLMVRELADRYRFCTEYYHEDYVLWLQMLQQGAGFAGTSEILVDYRYYPTSKAGNKLTSAKHRWEIYRRYLGLPRVKSVFYLAQYALAGAKKYFKVK